MDENSIEEFRNQKQKQKGVSWIPLIARMISCGLCVETLPQWLFGDRFFSREGQDFGGVPPFARHSNNSAILSVRPWFSTRHIGNRGAYPVAVQTMLYLQQKDEAMCES